MTLTEQREARVLDRILDDIAASPETLPDLLNRRQRVNITLDYVALAIRELCGAIDAAFSLSEYDAIVAHRDGLREMRDRLQAERRQLDEWIEATAPMDEDEQGDRLAAAARPDRFEMV